jgi:hypothetical protein
MRTIKRKALAAGAGALAAGCALAGVGVGTAHASVGVASAHSQPPSDGSGLAVKPGSITADGATLTWNRDPRASSYRVVIVATAKPTVAVYDSGNTLHGTSVTVTTLSPGTSYEARITANEGGGKTTGWSNWVKFTTTATAPASGGLTTKTYSLVMDTTGTSESIPTGGSFTAKAKSVGTVPLTAGTYLLNLNFMATPNATTTGDVYPQAFVYNGTTIAADFSNDLFNIGSGALAPYNAAVPGDQVNSYYSGSTVITVPAGGETLDIYGFGYDSDHGAGSYEMNTATLTATQLAPGASS